MAPFLERGWRQKYQVWGAHGDAEVPMGSIMVKSGGSWVGRYMNLEMGEDTRAAGTNLRVPSTDGFKDWGWKRSPWGKWRRKESRPGSWGSMVPRDLVEGPQGRKLETEQLRRRRRETRKARKDSISRSELPVPITVNRSNKWSCRSVLWVGKKGCHWQV